MLYVKDCGIVSKKIRKGSVVTFFQVLILLNLNDNKELVFFGLPGELVKLLSWQLRKEQINNRFILKKIVKFSHSNKFFTN